MAIHNPSLFGLLKNWVQNNIFYSYTDATVGVALVARRRFTIAEINAGTAWLPVLGPTFKYRMLDCIMIAIGGAVGAVTTIDILATQAAASVKLAAGAQASLTQSTLLRAGSAGIAVLANGASFVANDANTGITVGKTGATITVATHVDMIFSYVVEKV